MSSQTAPVPHLPHMLAAFAYDLYRNVSLTLKQ